MEKNNIETMGGQEQNLPQEELMGEIGLNQQDEYTRPQEQVIVSVSDEVPVPADIPMQTCADNKKQKRRRRNAIILLTALIVFVITAAASGFVFLNKYFTDRFFDESSQSSRPSATMPSAPPAVTPERGDENGPTVQLHDRPGADVPMMTIPEIYQEVSPSVVMILAGSDSPMALGTGIIMSEDGYIITNAHIVAKFENIQIVLHDNKTVYKAKIMGLDEATDIAVLKIEASNLKAAVFGNSDQVMVGESVVTIGNPHSLYYAQTVTDGIISGIRRYAYDGSSSVNFLQTNAQLNPGNSGGPLINMYGQVIGINSEKILSKGETIYEGMGFAIPMADAKEIVDELIRYGYIAPDPVIGITVTYVSNDSDIGESMVAGCMVMSVEPDSDAYKQGLRVGDIITHINGKTFDNQDDFIHEKNQFRVGDKIDIRYWRMGQYYDVKIQLIEAS